MVLTGLLNQLVDISEPGALTLQVIMQTYMQLFEEADTLYAALRNNLLNRFYI